MDYGRAAEFELRLRHRHSDGTWSPLERREPHDSADSDAERGWGTATLYMCKTCEEEVAVENVPKPAGRPG